MNKPFPPQAFSGAHRGTRSILAGVMGVMVLVAFAPDAMASGGETLVKTRCVGCHRITGQPMARSKKKAPDLIWAGSKYQRPWLVAWLQDPKEKLYPVGYDFNFTRKGPHLSITAIEAQQVADFLGTLKDARVKEGEVKPGMPEELARGEALYRDHGCQNCHWTPANNKRGYKGGHPAPRWSMPGIVFSPIGSTGLILILMILCRKVEPIFPSLPCRKGISLPSLPI